jgi:hypothetical protein
MIKQRILYVGIGGTGLDLGIELDSALKREICGMDGNALSQKGMAYPPNHLPPFVQQVYLDFDASSIASVSDQLVGSNHRTITNIIPTIGDYASVRQSLHMKNLGIVDSWIPAANGEPKVSPLSAGAGQFPTVGRAALFQSIHDQGLDQAILRPIQDAIADLSGSLGDLNAYTGGTANTNVAVYVGFSLSGGTGCGLFYDVLMLLINELRDQMTGTDVIVMPSVLLPSTFEDVLGPIFLQRANLNAASAIVDLGHLIEQVSQPNNVSATHLDVTYPHGSQYRVSSMTGNVQMPVAAIISKTPGMSRADTTRMLASGIVAQLSLDGPSASSGSQPRNSMSFGSKVVNMAGVIGMDSRTVINKPLMPMVSASLTVPSKQIADYVAKKLLVEAFREVEGGFVQPSSEEVDDLAKRILRQSGLQPLVDGEKFTGTYSVSFNAPTGIKNESELADKIANLKRSIDANAIPVVQSQIRERIRTMTTVSVLDGMDQILAQESGISIPVLVKAATRALTILQTVQTQDAGKSGSSTVRQGKKKKKSFIPGRKGVSQQDVKKEFERVQNDFDSQVKTMWMTEWETLKHQWRPSVQAQENLVQNLSGMWSALLESSETSTNLGLSAITQPRPGVRDFIPTRGMSPAAALSNIFSDSKTALFNNTQLPMQNSSNLVQEILGKDDDGIKCLREAFSVFRSSRTQNEFNEKVLSRIRSRVNGVFSHTPIGVTPVFSSLSTLIVEMAAGSTSTDAQDLRAQIGNLVPGVMVPNGAYMDASVLVGYPGEKNREVENEVAELVFSSGAMRQLVGAGPADGGSQIAERARVTMVPLGDSDSLTVNINLVGQSLFDNSEVCDFLRTWQTAARNSEPQMKWRQRLGYENLDQILVGDSRPRVLQQLLLGIWGGIIEVQSGTLDEPKVLIVHDENRQLDGGLCPLLELSSTDGHGGWTKLMSGFENLLVNIGGITNFSQDVITQLYNFVPNELRNSSEVEIPKQIQAILEARQLKLEEAHRALDQASNFNPEAISAYKAIIHFWDVEFKQAWNAPCSGGMRASSLDVLHHID